MEKLKNTKILGIVGNALIAVSVFLPVITSNFTSDSASLMNLTEAHSGALNMGIWILILAIINLVIIFADKLTGTVPVLEKISNQKFTLVPLIVAAILTFVAINSIMSIPMASLAVSYGFGFWTLIVGFVASAVYPFLYKGE